MADDKLDLPDDLIPTKASNRPAAMKVEASGGTDDKLDESKDQGAAESSIPLSPQWLYAKPTEAKMDTRIPNSLPGGNTVEPNPKEVWRLEGSEDKKDWRRIAAESETSRRWREEERETSLLGGRRERRKGERRSDGVSAREANDNRALSSSDRWHDGNIRNPGHDSRRDSKWSSRWGPEDREKELRTEKRTNIEKDKEDAHESQSFLSGNRSSSERDTESHDKWRPRHRMEVHSAGPAYSRAAPGFGVDRGRVESSNTGFSIGRGRSASIGRSSSGIPISLIHSSKGPSAPGKPNMSPDVFRYPRGKLLDMYRDQRHGPLFTAMPDGMEELPPITQKGLTEPLAFVAPNAEEEVLLNNIWKGKDTSSGVAYNSFWTGKSTENSSDSGDFESINEKQEIAAQVHPEEPVGMLLTVSKDDFHVKSGQDVSGEDKVDSASLLPNSDTLIPTMDHNNGICNTVQIAATPIAGERKALEDFLIANHPQHNSSESALSIDTINNIPNNPNSVSSFGSSRRSNGQHYEGINESNEPVEGISAEELTLCYIDPQGNVQGPFLGADIIMWFEEGFFGTDLMVRLADSAEGTPFQQLGELMPYLKVKEKLASSNDLNFKLEESGALEQELCATSATPTPGSEYVVSPAKSNLLQKNCEFDNPSMHTQSRISGPDKILKLSHSEAQGFDDFSAHDEEIVFPGKSKNTEFSNPEISKGIPYFLESSAGSLSLQNELKEIGISNQNDSKMQRFGMLWSEIEHTQMRTADSANIPSAGRAASFNTMAEPAVTGSNWSDHRKNTLVNHKLYQDTLAACHIPHIEQEPDRFDLADRLMSQQLQQQQLQQQNILSPHMQVDESFFEHVASQNLIQQRHLSNLSVPDLDHLLALQMQQQQQLQFQHRLQQQQQFHQQQKLLQERQQSQVRQALLEQLHRQIPKSGLGQSHADLIHSNSILDQVLLEQQLLHEMQQSHHSSRHPVSNLERLALANFGQSQQENHGDLFDIISHPRHGMQSLEHQLIQQGQLQRQLSAGLKHRNDERFLDSTWTSDQKSQFHSSHSGIHRVQSSGFNPLDIYQQHQRPLHEEQLIQLDRNHSLREQLQHGLFEPSSLPFERSLSLPSGATGMDLMNAMAHGHGLDMQEPSMHLPTADQAGAFSSGVHAHSIRNPTLSNQFHSSQFDPIEGNWTENNERLGNDWIETRLQAMNINAENKKRESQGKWVSESPALWMSEGLSDDKSRQLLMELLHQKSDSQFTESFDRAQSGIFPGSSSLDHQLSVLANHEASLGSSLPAGYGSSQSGQQQTFLADRQGDFSESSEKSLFRSVSGPLSEGEKFRTLIRDNIHPMYRDMSMTDMPYASRELLDAGWMNQGTNNNENMRKNPSFEVRDGIVRKGDLTSTEEKMAVENISGHPSLVMGFYNDQIASSNSFMGDAAKDSTQAPLKSQENMLLRRPSVSSMSSQEGFSEVYDHAGRARSPNGNDAGKQDLWTNLSNQGSEVTSSKKEMRFRRTSSYGEADVSDTSFIDMLKSNAKKNVVMESHIASGAEVSDGTQGKGAGKKKAKKGRQIDPALLGFKVASNRIMMGEIQRLDD